MIVIHRIDIHFNQHQRGYFFSKMDLRFKYHQLKVKNEDVEKTIFRRRNDYFEFHVMSFPMARNIQWTFF